MNVGLFLILALAAYVTGSVGYVGFWVVHSEFWHRVGHGFFVAGLVSHTVYLGDCFAMLGYLPVADLGSSIGFAAWALALVYVLVHLRYRLLVLGAVAGPLVSLLVMVSLGMPPKEFARPELLKSAWMFVHIVSVFAGDGAFILAAAAGALYLIQERAIKTKAHGFFFRRLPSLDVLDRLGYSCVALGFPLLTLGLVTGFVYARSVWGRWWSWDPKEVWSLVTWLVYAALLHERLAVGWRGRRAAIMALVGLAVLLFAFLGVNLLLPGHHGQFARF